MLFLFSLSIRAYAVTPPMNEDLPSIPNIAATNSLDKTNLTTMSTPEYVILRASDQATFSSETTASVAELFVKESSHFQAGDTLLTLDCRMQQADLNKALAQQQATQAAQASAKKLKGYDAISEYELTKAVTDAEMANADVAKLKAVVDKCLIKAPFNGAVADLMVHQHETVKPGDPLMKIVSTENLELELQVPSNWLQWLHIGYIFHVEINEINKTVDAKIIRINPQIEPVSQTVKIMGMITDSNTGLLPGMSGQAIFTNNAAH